jgi:hypothetical protein
LRWTKSRGFLQAGRCIRAGPAARGRGPGEPSLTRSEAFWARDGCRRTGTGGIRPQTFEGPLPLEDSGRSRSPLQGRGDLPAEAGISAEWAALGGENFPSGAPPGGGGRSGAFLLPHRVLSPSFPFRGREGRGPGRV